MKTRIALLGSTGSIGVNALKVISSLNDRFEITALCADSNIKALSGQARSFDPKVLCVRDGWLSGKLKALVHPEISILNGADGLEEIVSRPDVDIVIFAISGSSCIAPLLCAIKNRKRIALANKESLVSAGAIVMPLAKKNNVSIIPIDSEHSAIFQCLGSEKRPFLNKIYLTATGGPLLDIPKKRFDSLSRKFILNHPKWKMGSKISVDSATMMNKGLEVIEARWLFDTEEDRIDVLVHPEAAVHSMIELIDGTVFAQISLPDMRLPIQYAITYPARFCTEVEFLNFSKIKHLSFRKPDLTKFPCLRLAREALKKGGTYPAVLNAADEEAVKSYLGGKIKFSRIPIVIEKVLEHHKRSIKEPSIGDIMEAESWAREETVKLCR
ncbi:MAG: 1-deoxy-D-xylulose-5-phosphate reductoisomerase [Candidatus Omnitrophica bacterium]|nr:1-deoxy-D-xylulose-5-phosphate reductoisomerase [Candidatus Omnitrophota bacterium]